MKNRKKRLLSSLPLEPAWSSEVTSWLPSVPVHSWAVPQLPAVSSTLAFQETFLIIIFTFKLISKLGQKSKCEGKSCITHKKPPSSLSKEAT
jgi:hypothetical protein